jgi:hypothetical protein
MRAGTSLISQEMPTDLLSQCTGHSCCVMSYFGYVEEQHRLAQPSAPAITPSSWLLPIAMTTPGYCNPAEAHCGWVPWGRHTPRCRYVRYVPLPALPPPKVLNTYIPTPTHTHTYTHTHIHMYIFAYEDVCIYIHVCMYNTRGINFGLTIKSN